MLAIRTLSPVGIKEHQDNVDTIRNWPTPCDVEELRIFLGFTGYYCRFVKDYSKIACAVLYQETDGVDRVIAYASRDL